jgi:glycosyltransferase involved in cell wall biosynthesis
MEELRTTGAAVAKGGLQNYLEGLESLAARKGRFVPWNRFLPRLLGLGLRPLLVRSGVGGVDLYHSLFSDRPTCAEVCRISTVHDLIPILFPSASNIDPRRFERTVKAHIRDSHAIIVPSEATRSDLVRYYGVDPSRLHVVYHGIDFELFRTERQQDDEVLARYGLRRGTYLLHAGALEERKNLERLLDAYLLARHAHGLQLLLVLAGARAQPLEKFHARIRQPELQPFVRLLGYVPDNELAVLYRNARALTLVSVYEGFGFPALEAMACGTPVVGSNSSALAEVIASNGLLVNPQDIAQIATALGRIADDEQLYLDMRGRGLRYCQEFTWERAARSTLAVYEKTLGRFVASRRGARNRGVGIRRDGDASVARKTDFAKSPAKPVGAGGR